MDSVRTAQRRTLDASDRRSFESEPAMRQLNLHVGGMSCRRCVREVTARLRDVPGVETVTADPGDCLVRLSGSMQLTDVLAAFGGTSYRPRLLETMTHDSGGTASGKPAK
jgi:copper chaperone CopZ